MKNLSFSTINDIGINPLTGEACAYSMRTLCDLSQEGANLVADYLGILTYPGPVFTKNWNSMVGHSMAVGSVMLEHTAFGPLMRFALFRKGFEYVYENSGDWIGGDLIGLNDSDIEGRPILSMYVETPEKFGGKIHRNPAFNSSQPREGSRNVHAFTGRAE